MTPQSAALWEPRVEDLARDPHPLYDEVRGPRPVWWRRSEELQGWALFDHASVSAALADPRLSVARTLPPRFDPAEAPMAALVARWVQFQDPPGHEALRRPLQAALGRAWAGSGVQDRLPALARRLVEEAREQGEFDLMASLAVPLPVAVVADLLGMPEEDRPLVRRWAAHLVAFLGVEDPGDAANRWAGEAAAEMGDYFARLWRRARGAPGADLLGTLAAWEHPPPPEADVVASCVQLLFAGHETTIHLVGNGVLALLRHPETLRDLRARPEILDDVVEELLRHDGPVQLTNRVALAACEIGPHRIRPGEFAFLVLGAANRDPLRFPDPHRLDPARPERRHLAFGAGRHFCLGAALARAEAAAVLAALLEASRDLELLTPEPDWQPLDFFRGFPSLRLRLVA